MNIVILGAGRVGEVLTKQLQNGEHDITVVDADRDFLQTVRSLGENIRTVPGDATLTAILDEAEVDNADLLIAVTGSDSVNIVASQFAKTFFKTPTIIARVRSLDIDAPKVEEYRKRPLARVRSRDIDARMIEEYRKLHLSGITIINPETLASEQLKELLKHPGAHQVLNLCDAKIKLIALRISETCPLRGLSPSEFNLPKHAKIIAAFDEDGKLREGEDYKIQRYDMAVFIAPSERVNETITAFVGKQNFAKRICIAGLGRVGSSIADALREDTNYRMDLIEVDYAHADQASARFIDPAITVHNGSAHDRTFLENCDVDMCDVFCATTNNDEINILAALEALNVGANQAVALVSRGHYKRILTRDDLVVSSLEQITANSILSSVIEGATQTCVLHTGATEVVEIKIEGEFKDSKVAGRRVGDLKIPGQAHIAMIVRGDLIDDAQEDFLIQSGDIAIVFVPHSRDTAKVVRYFQVKATALFL